ncbi:tetraacyldisaccharide 4'-kinase [Flexithrix dorotheae]|uniref:tetraacyldisaccharide 4'-kinase n=1 Tax=Flexithrix dorotheae TaxID=70993 RepID=UPI00037D7008|nr:tetraacyldisaccharide 4'-kinase [Flexithrix dorotheae]
MHLFKLLLFPFSILYDFITRFRNHLYDIGNKPSVRFDVPVVNVGNITVGGTGKTPHIEYLIRNLKSDFKLGTLSRGYGRKTKGLVIADHEANAKKIGDEPFQFYSKFGDEITVAVCEERIIGIPAILSEAPETEVVLLDDAFQHRKVKPQLNILLTDYKRLFTKDFVLPFGRLRESRYGAKRADCVIVSKCPEDLEEREKNQIEEEIIHYTKPETPVFFTKISYGVPKAVFDNNSSSEASLQKANLFLVTGIANSQYLTSELEKEAVVLGHKEFPDHHEYALSDAEKIIAAFQKLSGREKYILTTEKDAVKFRSPEFQELFRNIPFYYLPIEVSFQNGESDFLAIVKNKIREANRNNK